MPADKIKEARRAYADLRQAQNLLLDDKLVWSNDFDSIRIALARALSVYALHERHDNTYLLEIARILIAEENDLSIGE